MIADAFPNTAESTIRLVYWVGNGDLALPTNASPDERERALRDLEEDPDFWLRFRSDHTAQAMHPLLAVIDHLERDGHPVDAVFLIATRQSPAHPGDTYRIAEALRTRLGDVPVASAPADVRIIEIENLTVASIFESTRKMWRRAAKNGRIIALPMGTGATSGYVGLLLAALAEGVQPLLLELNREDPRQATRLQHSFSVERWLFRRRMWASLANLVAGDDRAHFEILRDQESLVNNRRAAANDQWTAQMAATYSALVAGSPVAAVRMNTALEIRLRDILSGVDKSAESIQEIIRSIRGPDPNRRNVDESLLLVEAAKQSPMVFDRVVTAANDDRLRALWSGGARSWKSLYDGCTKYRHNHRTPLDWREFVDGFIDFAEDQDFRDPTPRNIDNRDFMERPQRFGRCRTPSTPVMIVIRPMGKSDNSAPVIDEAVVGHARRESAESDTPIAAVVRLWTSAIEFFEPNHPERSVRLNLSTERENETLSKEIQTGLRSIVDDIEGDGSQHIKKIIVAVSQGTKAINTAVILESLAIATELDAMIDFIEPARGDLAGTTTHIRSIATLDTRAVSRSLFGNSTVLPLLRHCLEELNPIHGRALMSLAPATADSIIDGLRAFFDEVSDPFAKVARGRDRLERLLPHVALLRDQYVSVHQGRPVIRRDAEELFVTQLSTLLSSATQSTGLPDDCWKKTPDLAPLWTARNALFHDGRMRKEGGPRGPSGVGAIAGLDAHHIGFLCAEAMNLEPPRINANRLIDERSRLVAEIDSLMRGN